MAGADGSATTTIGWSVDQLLLWDCGFVIRGYNFFLWKLVENDRWITNFGLLVGYEPVAQPQVKVGDGSKQEPVEQEDLVALAAENMTMESHFVTLTSNVADELLLDSEVRSDGLLTLTIWAFVPVLYIAPPYTQTPRSSSWGS